MKNWKAFTVVELLVVLSILAILVALLFPVFANAREKGRQSQCLSNLHQLGGAIALYVTDYDEHIPYAIDPFELAILNINPAGTDLDLGIVNRMPHFIPTMQPYIKSKAVYQCPSEHRFDYQDVSYFNYFQKYGSSYQYAIYPAYLHWTLEDFKTPAEQYLMADIGYWHGGSNGYDGKINELFADFHVKTVAWEYYLGTVVPYGL